MSHPDQNAPGNWADLVITGVGLPTVEAVSPETFPALPGTVCLAPDACLVRSHLDQPEDEPTVINVVGTSNCDDLAGWVLMLR